MNCSLCETPTNKRCSRCHSKYYCGRSCQKTDYTNHVIECPPRSADTLVKNALRDEMPTKMEVLYEYGFSNCTTPQERTMLLGMYIGLIKMIGCDASQIHSWWESGDLPRNIKKAYGDEGHTSEYYRWFLKNERLLHGLHKYEGEKSDESMFDRYLAIIKPYLSEHDQKVPIQSLPETKRQVATFYTIMISGWIPSIEQEHWFDFGFCTCKDVTEERRLGELYRELIIQKGCKIDEFHDAYVSGSITDLLSKKCVDCSWLSEGEIVLRPKESVYYLKRYALSDSVDLVESVDKDYGFSNCRSKDEEMQLKQMYKKLINTPQFDPRDLHEACLAGKIFNYVNSILPDEVVKADLLKNKYPLKDFE